MCTSTKLDPASWIDSTFSSSNLTFRARSCNSNFFAYACIWAKVSSKHSRHSSLDFNTGLPQSLQFRCIIYCIAIDSGVYPAVQHTTFRFLSQCERRCYAVVCSTNFGCPPLFILPGAKIQGLMGSKNFIYICPTGSIDQGCQAFLHLNVAVFMCCLPSAPKPQGSGATLPNGQGGQADRQFKTFIYIYFIILIYYIILLCVIP